MSTIIAHLRLVASFYLTEAGHISRATKRRTFDSLSAARDRKAQDR